MRAVRVFLCEPYFGGSHQAWAEGYVRTSAHDVHLLTHPASFWKWRMQGAALTMAHLVDDAARRYGPPDLLLVSDMVHVPALLGLCGRHVGRPAVLLYMHENQLTYPAPEGSPVDLSYAMTNWLSMAAADLVVFNSNFHRQELLGALPRLLGRFPDHRHATLLDEVAARCEVLPIGIDVTELTAPPRPGRGSRRPLVLWNQRWEYDKDPTTFFTALDAVRAGGLDFDVAIAGQNFRNHPAEFDAGIAKLGDRVIHAGWLPRAEYVALLRRADVVVSTAQHEFFGVAVAEAVAAGAFPVAPDRLAYPEILGPEGTGCLYGDEGELVALLGQVIADSEFRRRAVDRLAPSMSRFDWSTLARRYDEAALSLVESVGLNGGSRSAQEAP